MRYLVQDFIIKNDGTITAQEINFLVNTGAYITGGSSIASAMCYKLYQLYKNVNLKITAAPVYTNITPAGAMRSYGAPQLMFGHQVQMNKISRKLGLDITNIHLKNLIEPNSFNPLTGMEQGNVRGIDCVIEGQKYFDWNKRQKPDNSTGTVKRGVGMAVTSLWNGVFGVHIDATGIRITLNEDGTFILHTPTHEMGQGTSIALAQITAEILGVDTSDIHIVESDTDSCLWDLGAFASRGIYVSGEAARLAAIKMKDKILQKAAKNFQINSDYLLLHDKRITLENKEIVTLEAFARDLLLNHYQHLEVNHTYGSLKDRTSYAAHFAEIEVDEESGTVKVLDYLAVHDVGKIINRLGIEGQVEGGVQMGLGFALSEELERNENGALKTQNFRKYKIFRAQEMPEIRSHFIEEIDFPGPFGAKCVSEIATVPVAPAIVNAITNALGKDFKALPLKASQLKA